MLLDFNRILSYSNLGMPRKKKRRRRTQKTKLTLPKATINSLVAILFISFGLLILVSLSGQGLILTRTYQLLSQAFGASYFLLAFLFIAGGFMFVDIKASFTKPNVFLGTLLVFLGFLGALKTGYIGQSVFLNTANLLSSAGAYITFFALAISGALILTQMSWGEWVELVGLLLKPLKRKPKEIKRAVEVKDEPRRRLLPRLSLPKIRLPKRSLKTQAAPESSTNKLAPTSAVEVKSPAKDQDVSTDDILKTGSTTPTVLQRVWEYPPLSLLSDSHGGEADRGDVKKNSDIIENALESFGIRAQVKEVNAGPAVTQYALQIARGTRLSRITALGNDLAMHLSAPGGQIRIEAPIAGRDLVGIEVPNKRPAFVTLRYMLEQKVMIKHPSKLAVALGLDISNHPVVADIASMPHILIAGATGSGKSVAINAFLTSILFRASPAEVKFILVDPKRVELSSYDGIPHLLTPVIDDTTKVVPALKWAVNEMEERYKKLQSAGVRNIDSYNEVAGHIAMHKIVIIIGELADVMMLAPGDVEKNITLLAQKARAVGIHLVLATQRPSVDVLTGLIKANIPARIAFNVSSMTDSRVIIDTPGAEKLLGKGDMLFLPPDRPKPYRVQGTFVSDQEVKRLVQFIKERAVDVEYQDEVTTKFKSTSSKNGVIGDDGEERDELFLDVAKFVVQQGKASSSMIQRRFSVGYNRAARILDQLHSVGMVGPQEGSKPRTVNAARIMEFIHQQEGTE